MPERPSMTPWPDWPVFGLGNDLLGFHLRLHCQNFLDTIDRAIEARVDQETFTIDRGGHTTTVRPFPISIDFEQQDQKSRSAAVEREMEHWRTVLKPDGTFIGLGIDRVDYTKGIPDCSFCCAYYLSRRRAGCPRPSGRSFRISPQKHVAEGSFRHNSRGTCRETKNTARDRI